MNNDITITDSNKFEQIVENFNNIVTNMEISFEKQNGNFSNIEGTDTWSGDLQESVSLKYRELSNNYDTIIASLRTLSDFMTDTINAYKTLEGSLQTSVEDNSNELNVNS